MLHPRLAALFADFDQAGVRWCLLRRPTGKGRADGDVDLLVDGQHIEPARQALVGQGFTRVPGWKPGLHFLSYDRPTSQWLWMHLVSELSFGSYSLLRTAAEAACLERRQEDGASFNLS